MNNLNVLSIGGSRNIGYFSSIRLLDSGATVTFLLRRTGVFDNDETIQKYIGAGKAKLLQGDALVKEDVKRAWTAAMGENGRPVDFLVFTVGGTPQFKLTKGFIVSPPDLVTRCLLNCLETLPTPYPNIITISSSGVTREDHRKLPLLLKPLYSYFLALPHEDKRGAEEVLAYCAGWDWKEVDRAGPEVLDPKWKSSPDLPAPGTLTNVVVVRPALFTDGACRADAGGSTSGDPYIVEEGDVKGRWTVSRRDVGHFVVEGLVKHWDKWKGKRVGIAY